MAWISVFSQNSFTSTLFLLIYCVCLTNAIRICNPSNNATSKSRRAKSGNCDEFPYVVFIGKTGNENYTCIGSIVHREWVLTAGRCVAGHNRTELYVISGSNAFTPNDRRHVVVTTIANPNFNPNNFTDNLAMLQVYPPFMYDNRTKSIAIGPPSEGGEAVTVGWGGTEKINKSESLRSLKLKIISAEECHTKTDEAFDKLPGEMCGEGKGTPCNGDWGAPLVLGGKVVGVFSYRVDKCSMPTPVVFSEVEYYKCWIEEVLRKCDCELTTTK